MLWLLLILMGGVAAGAITFPLWRDQQCTLALFLSLGIMTCAIGGYWLVCYTPALHDYLYIQNHPKQIAQLAAELKTPHDAILRIQAKLAVKPHDPKGWYLLGRLYVSNGEFIKAEAAFAKANHYRPHQVDILLNYVEAMFYAHHQRLNAKAQGLLQELLALSPHHPVALNFLALDAYQRKHYSEAIHYWEALLPQLQLNSAAAESVLGAIKTARGHTS